MYSGKNVFIMFYFKQSFVKFIIIYFYLELIMRYIRFPKYASDLKYLITNVFAWENAKWKEKSAAW